MRTRLWSARISTRAFLTGLFMLGSGGACSKSVCEPGKVVSCPCPGNFEARAKIPVVGGVEGSFSETGTQECAQDGVRWLSCNCSATGRSNEEIEKEITDRWDDIDVKYYEEYEQSIDEIFGDTIYYNLMRSHNNDLDEVRAAAERLAIDRVLKIIINDPSVKSDLSSDLNAIPAGLIITAYPKLLKKIMTGHPPVNKYGYKIYPLPDKIDEVDLINFEKRHRWNTIVY